jgi:large-conductance mechanosensitive channel
MFNFKGDSVDSNLINIFIYYYALPLVVMIVVVSINAKNRKLQNEVLERQKESLSVLKEIRDLLKK